jgi:hypothetical protein
MWAWRAAVGREHADLASARWSAAQKSSQGRLKGNAPRQRETMHPAGFAPGWLYGRARVVVSHQGSGYPVTSAPEA